MEIIVVVDFEIIGFGFISGGWVIEIVVVWVCGGVVVDIWFSLMNSGVWVLFYIQVLMGISNEMLVDVFDLVVVMCELVCFMVGCLFVVYNVVFDCGFWQVEMQCVGIDFDLVYGFVCIVLLFCCFWFEVFSYLLGVLICFYELYFSGCVYCVLVDVCVMVELLLKVWVEVVWCFVMDFGDQEVDYVLLFDLQCMLLCWLWCGLVEYVKVRWVSCLVV